jgi:hypothetical protein
MRPDPRANAASESPARPHEATEATDVAISQADALAKVTAVLSRLADVLERQSRPPVERLCFRLEEVAAACSVSRRAVERERAAGRFPKPDLTIGKMPLWRVETVRSFLERGGR